MMNSYIEQGIIDNNHNKTWNPNLWQNDSPPSKPLETNLEKRKPKMETQIRILEMVTFFHRIIESIVFACKIIISGVILVAILGELLSLII